MGQVEDKGRVRHHSPQALPNAAVPIGMIPATRSVSRERQASAP
jgi:hypothetical protein